MPDTLPQYLCIETNYNQDKNTPSPNFGMPFCEMPEINANGEWGPAPNYIRVLGPFDLADLEQRTCAENNITPFYYDKSGNKVNTTKGWYAVCEFNKKNKTAISIELDYPPIRTIYPAAIGPFDTKEIADQAAEILTTKCERKYQEAMDVCSPSPIYNGNVNICCSLFATDIGWPMEGGDLQLMFYPEQCFQANVSNNCISSINISLGCTPSLDPVIEKCWNGVSSWIDVGTNTGTIENPIPRGYTIRFVAKMCVLSYNSVSIDVNMQWLVNPYDINPDKPPQDPIISSCGSFSSTLYLTPPSITKHENRLYTSGNYVDGIFVGTYIKFEPSCSYLKRCMAAITPLVKLFPKKFGCDGTVAKGPLCNQRCSLDDYDTSMSCLQGLVEPLNPLADMPKTYIKITNAVGDGENIVYTCINNIYSAGQTVSIQGLKIVSGESLNLTNVKIETASPTQFTVKDTTIGVAIFDEVNDGGKVFLDNWRPYFFNLGVNLEGTKGDEGNTLSDKKYGCMRIVAYSERDIRSDPAEGSYGGHSLKDIAFCGYSFTNNDSSGGKEELTDRTYGAIQQVQMGGSGFLIKRLHFDVADPSNPEMKKRVYGPLFAAMALRKNAAGETIWETSSVEIIQTFGPWMAKCVFPKNNAVVHLYGFSFPPPVLEECPGGYPTTTPAPFLSNGPPNIESLLETEKNDYINTLKNQIEKMNKVCIYLGDAIPNTKTCCGASPSFQCEKHGRCKQYGVAGPEDNMVCSSCPDFS